MEQGGVGRGVEQEQVGKDLSEMIARRNTYSNLGLVRVLFYWKSCVPSDPTVSFSAQTRLTHILRPEKCRAVSMACASRAVGLPL